MALMIPSTCPADAPPGEKELFRRLRDDPDTDGWTILHGLDLARHVNRVCGEADFVVVAPGLGILVIEVKSHTHIHVDDRGWHMGGDPEPDQRGPFKQAAEALHSLRAYLRDRDASLGRIVAWSCVCFPRVDFHIKSPEWHDWQVIDRRRLTSAPISRTIRTILENGGELLESKNVISPGSQQQRASEPSCNALVGALRPKFDLAMPPKARRREEDAELLELTAEQYSALDQTALNPRVIFDGAAGTGKTVLAVEALRRCLAENLDLNVGLLCFNKLLGEQLKGAAAQLPSSAVVGNIDSWMVRTAHDKITPEDRVSDTFFKGRLAEICMEELMECPEPPFDFLIVDEAQDLMRNHYLDVIDLALKGGLAGGRWLFFGDFRGQDIFSQGEVTVEEFLETRCPHAARYSLRVNCRNTRPISAYVVALGQLAPPYTKVLRGDSREDPELRFWRSSQEESNLVSDFVSRCLAAGFRQEDIVLLSPRAKGSLGERLSGEPDWKSRIEKWSHPSTKIRYSTIQAFKGLESPVVILTDFVQMDSREQHSLFYIALSRALHRLGIFLHDDLKNFVRSIT